MDRSIVIIFYNALLLTSAVVGYVARRRGWLKREHASIFMVVAMLAFETPLGLLSVWRLKMESGTWLMPLVGAALAGVMLLAGLALSRPLRLTRLQIPSFATSASASNIGYTLAGFIALAMIGVDGLGYLFIYVLFGPFFLFLAYFSIAQHYTSNEPPHPLVLLWKSVTDIRALPLYGVIAGIILNQAGVPYPEELLGRVHVIDVLFAGGIIASYTAIGVSVVFSAMRPYLRQSVVICVLKFVAAPLVMFGMVSALGFTGSVRQLCLLQSFMPSAVQSVIVATFFGTDRDLAVTNFLVSHAVLLAVVLPFVLPWAIHL